MLTKPFFNPGNLERCYDNNGKELYYVGQRLNQTNSIYRQFVSIDYGYRALLKLLSDDFRIGLNTVTKIISHYAPGSGGNDTNQYIINLCCWLDFKKDEVLPLNDEILVRLACAISRQENGVAAILKDVYAGLRLLNDKI